MLKKIMFTGVLLISFSALKAKNITPVNSFVPTTILTNIDEGLVNKLAGDIDFKNYYISQVKFANKITESKAGSLFLKYIQNSITANEQVDLFAKMEVKSKKEFDAVAINLQNEAVAFFKKFPELKQVTEKAQKELLVSAFKKLSNNKMLTHSFVKAKNPSAIECFWYWTACATSCAIACSGQPNSCYWTCEGICAGFYGICWLQSE